MGSTFHAPRFTVVDRGSNLLSSNMNAKLSKFSSQLCLISAEALWSLGSKKRSHRSLAKILYTLQLTDRFRNEKSTGKLLGESEMAWNCSHHANRELSDSSQFGVMPRGLGELSSISVQDQIAIMQTSQSETGHHRASMILSKAFSPFPPPP